ncbi:hypothetical protein OH76DRAFT_1423437 [Lentinus brumalis]|uniref:Calcineurin-like phosphoesterase domain-containing protein n=1 Tax=Lentinus brumalis TaxID=2498619 RepID=A0A371CKT4_9APHY|nr:hypothetical protein OH76DRAFT_1423437 [Polyporus brumalis]
MEWVGDSRRLGDLVGGGLYASLDDSGRAREKKKGKDRDDDEKAVCIVLDLLNGAVSTPVSRPFALVKTSSTSSPAGNSRASCFSIICGRPVLLVDQPAVSLPGIGTRYTAAQSVRAVITKTSLPNAFHSLAGNTRPILFTHVPLSRPEGASCGPLRERGTLRQGRGLRYQNLLSPQASQFLLQTIRPAIVFSGDDHDYCEYVHTVHPTNTKRPSPPASVPEVTVKSSMAMGVRRPGYQLLSLIPPHTAYDGQSLAHRPCLLPDQLDIYLSVYIPLFELSLIVLLTSKLRRVVVRRATSNADGEVEHGLPPPSAWRNKEFPWYGSWSWTCTLGGSRRRIVLPRFSVVRPTVEFLWSGAEREGDERKRAGVAKGTVRDFWEAAWAQLVLFVGIAWWVW